MRNATFLYYFAVACLVIEVRPGTPATSTTSTGIPRSTCEYPRVLYSDRDSPPWNPSSLIDDDGFLKQKYHRVPGEWEVEFPIGGIHRKSTLEGVPVRVRQVPGDGNCLFHALSVCLSHAENGTHFNYRDLEALKRCSRRLREHAVEYLRQKPRRVLFLQGSDDLRAKELVDSAAAQYNCSGEEYCETMRQESYWGGGPEIVALCNHLRRPIHVYELCTQKKAFCLRRMACFGSPKFDRKEALHILSADSRFPDVTPGKQLESGDHFLAMFPEARRTKHKVRGGGADDGPIAIEDQLLRDTRSHEKPSRGRGLRSFVAYWWSLILGHSS